MPGIYKNGMKLIPGGYVDLPINGIRSYPDQFGRILRSVEDIKPDYKQEGLVMNVSAFENEK